MMARCDEQRGRGHESSDEETWATHDAHLAELQVLQAVPALKAAIESCSPEDVDTVWDQYGPLGDLDDEEA
jgi:hypothetical protein